MDKHGITSLKSDPDIFIWLEEGEERYSLSSCAELETNFGIISSNDDCFC